MPDWSYRTVLQPLLFRLQNLLLLLWRTRLVEPPLQPRVKLLHVAPRYLAALL